MGSVDSIFASAVTGVRSATHNFAKHAAAIAHQSVSNYEDRVEFSSAGRALAAKSQQVLGGGAPPPSMERSMVGQIVAKNDLAANVASLRTADEVLAKLVRLGDRGR